MDELQMGVHTKKTTCFLLPQQTSRKGVAEAAWNITATRNVPSSLRLTGRRNLQRRLIFLGEVEKHCSWIWICARRTGKPPPCHLKKTRTKGVTDEAQVPGWIAPWLVCSFIPHQSQLVVAPPVASVCDCSREIVSEAQTAEESGAGRDHLDSAESLRGHIKQHARVSAWYNDPPLDTTGHFPTVDICSTSSPSLTWQNDDIFRGLVFAAVLQHDGDSSLKPPLGSALCGASWDVGRAPAILNLVCLRRRFKALWSKKKVAEVGVRSHSSFRTPPPLYK